MESILMKNKYLTDVAVSHYYADKTEKQGLYIYIPCGVGICTSFGRYGGDADRCW